LLKTLPPKGEEVKAKIEKHWTRARARTYIRIKDHASRRDKLYFSTSPQKAVYRQLQAHPRLEILAMDGQNSVHCVEKADFAMKGAIARDRGLL